MKTNRLIALVVVFAALAALYVVSENVSKRQETVDRPLLFPDFTREDVQKITVTSPEKGMIVMERQAQQWLLAADNETHRAASSEVNKLLDTVSGFKTGTVVSRNPTNFAAFQVTEETGIGVRIADAAGDPLAAFYVGKSGPDIFSTYLKKAGAGEVILNPGVLKTVFDKEVDEWRDKTIFALAERDIQTYRIDGDISLVLERAEDGQWQAAFPETFPVDQQAAGRAVGRFSGLSAAGFEKGPPESFGLDAPSITITATFKDGSTKTLVVGDEKNSFQSFAMVEGEDKVYVVEHHNLEIISPDIDSLRQAQEAEEVQTGG